MGTQKPGVPGLFRRCCGIGRPQLPACPCPCHPPAAQRPRALPVVELMQHRFGAERASLHCTALRCAALRCAALHRNALRCALPHCAAHHYPAQLLSRRTTRCSDGDGDRAAASHCGHARALPASSHARAGAPPGPPPSASVCRRRVVVLPTCPQARANLLAGKALALRLTPRAQQADPARPHRKSRLQSLTHTHAGASTCAPAHRRYRIAGGVVQRWRSSYRVALTHKRAMK